jgi:uncharacterized protein (DUF779 family)
MKAIAKRNMGYPEYPYINWIKGHEYNAIEHTLSYIDIIDEKGIVFHFQGTKEDLTMNLAFDFKEEE